MPTGGPYTDVQIYNLKLGYDGEASSNHRICLPKIRPFDRAATQSVSYDPVPYG